MKNNKQENWIEELKERIDKFGKGGMSYPTSCECGGELDKDKLISFIKDLLASQREEIIKEHRKFLKDLKLGFDVWRCDCGDAWKDSDGADMVKEELKRTSPNRRSK